MPHRRVGSSKRKGDSRGGCKCVIGENYECCTDYIWNTIIIIIEREMLKRKIIVSKQRSIQNNLDAEKKLVSATA
jgi:hypothetical protein